MYNGAAMEHFETDVLILGGGLSGLMAAKHLTDRVSCRVMVAAAGLGASPWVHGFSVPVAEGDSPECFYRDTIESGRGESRADLARALCFDAEDCFRELQAAGLCFNREESGYQLLQPLGSSYPRVVSIGNETGPAILKMLKRELDGKVDFVSGRALRLRREGGRAAGALIRRLDAGSWMTVGARAVILACGGCCGIYAFSTNKPDSGGDGVAMAYDIGCRVTGMEFVQFEPSAAVWPASLRGTSVITTLYKEGAVLRDREGRRFMAEADPVNAELVNKDIQARRMAQVIAAGRGTDHGGVYFDATPVDPDLLREKYPAYVRRYARAGVDITHEMMEVAPAPHTSLGGVVITPEGCTDVPGLYACGEVAGGLHGANRIGGSAGLETLVFGRRAGEACAADLDPDIRPVGGWEEWAEPLTAEDGASADWEGLRRSLGEAMQEGAGVLRDERGLRNALAELKAIRCRTETAGGDAYRRLRLQNDLTAAELICAAALKRRGSLGCHTRTDGPQAG